MRQKFKFLEHTADIKFQAFGNNAEEVFENSALAMLKTMCKNKVQANKKIKINIKGKDFESLLYNFLEEFLFLLDSQNFLFSKIKNLKITENFKLSAEILGDNSENYEISQHVKAVTYNEMFIKEKNNKWTAQVVLDV